MDSDVAASSSTAEPETAKSDSTTTQTAAALPAPGPQVLDHIDSTITPAAAQGSIPEALAASTTPQPAVISCRKPAPLDPNVKDSSNELQVAESETKSNGNTQETGSESGQMSETPVSQPQLTGHAVTSGESTESIIVDLPSGLESDPQIPSKATPNNPWQDIMITMLLELGLVETSRMMAAEELVLSAMQRESAPDIINKFTALLQESVFEAGKPTRSMADSGPGASKRQNVEAMDIDSDATLFDSIKRRRVDDASSMIQENATRGELEKRMADFIATKREQINESNRQEFIKGDNSRADAPGAEWTNENGDDDDGCARVDARKLNRTTQMKLETVKNEALTKTNPRAHTQASDPNMATSGLDERLRNIQVHLNLRIAAMPTCTIAERVRIVEDVIIQLERDYPLWSALHFNQPNRVFPPPPSVTTVSRNAKNQIIMSGEHLRTTLIEHGDMLAAPASAALAHYPSTIHQPSLATNQAGALLRHDAAATDIGSSPGVIVGHGVDGDGKGVTLAGPGKVGFATQAGVGAGVGGSATVIKLKRHGGAGSSSLARAVQQQLAQRKANAAAGGHIIDEQRHHGLIVSSHLTAGKPAVASSSLLYASSPGSSSAQSPNVDFSDPLKAGVTGRGPIKSRRKSIAKGLEPAASGVGSPSSSHSGSVLGTSSGSLGTGAHLGPGNNHVVSAASEASLGSVNISKPKTSSAKKPRKKKRDNATNDESVTQGSRAAGAGRGKGGFGLGRGKGGGMGGGRPAMGLGLGKGKGGAYRQELLRRAEVEDFDEESDDDDINDGKNFHSGIVVGGGGSNVSGSGNGVLAAGNTAMYMGDNSAPTPLVSSALQDQANMAVQAQGLQQQQQQLQQQQQAPKSKKQPRKPSTPAKLPPVRKFGGKSFGMAGGESSGSSSNESSDGEGSGSSGSQSDSSSSSGGSISGSGHDSD
ncbi:hypothetical protein EDD11_002534 [Mortierella claussenii]|nr:hypothetical protein EDD11_002534 [Mortierella claussenii]